MPLSLVADVGGTNTRVALARGTQLQTGSLRKFRNADFAGIDAVLARFIAEEGVAPPAGACVAGAGPVMDGAVVMTNLFDDRGQPWIIDAGRVAAATGAGRVAILNDLQAQGHALGHLAADQVSLLVPGPQVAGAAMLLTSPGPVSAPG
ncbi:MAG: glucokinase [Rhodobacterales bacterium]|nr:glucokinase [Rhodobacterales bacterium]